MRPVVSAINVYYTGLSVGILLCLAVSGLVHVTEPAPDWINLIATLLSVALILWVGWAWPIAETAPRKEPLTQHERRTGWIVLLVPVIPVLFLSGFIHMLWSHKHEWVTRHGLMLAIAALMTCGASAMIAIIAGRRLRLLKLPNGACRRCHYDLRGRPDASTCPECGYELGN